MVEELLPDVYDIPLGDRFRAYLFARETPTLMDTGLAETTDELFAAIDSIGVEPERVVVTHGDPDHVGGLPAVRDRYDATVWVPEETDLGDTTADLGTAAADRRYGDGDQIGPFEAVHLPGHAPDNHALVDETAGVAVMGDAVSGADQRGLPAGYLLLPPAVFSADLNRAERSLERLLEYEFDAALVFHGSPVLADADAKLERFVEFPGKP